MEEAKKRMKKRGSYQKKYAQEGRLELRRICKDKKLQKRENYRNLSKR